MKNFILAAATLGFVSTASFAADVPSSRKQAAAPAIEQPSDWEGAYLGLKAGVSRNTMKFSDIDNWYSGLTDVQISGTSPAFGVKAGYDAAFGSLLAGVGLEASLGNFRVGGEISPPQPAYLIRSQANMLGSLRGKVGVTTPQIALFGTAGLALANTKHSYDETDGTGQWSRSNGKRLGWVAGLGADYSLGGKSSIGLEISHYQFGDDTYSLNGIKSTEKAMWRQSDAYESLMVNYTQRF